MEKGKISPPVWGGRGWHILYLLSRRTTDDLLFAHQFALERAELLKTLREEADIQIYDL
jgi:parvulin-like peptidyl-prolyl isomerase